ncbi:MAG TPA: DsbA family protein [Candidatus Nanoarchaeia archaeon]|nr:DsbA family protein [Candidatus Nanoarchaeia archaeon]
MHIAKVMMVLIAAILVLSSANLIYTYKLGNKIENLQNPALGAGKEQPENVDTKLSVSDGGSPSIGSEDAKVTIIEFSDFQCPYCGKFYFETFPSIYSDYIKTGKVRFVMRNFPLGFHQYAEKTAEAAECANEQDKFWEYQNLLFINQKSLDDENLKKYASDLKLDSVKFDSCLDSGKMAGKIQADLSDAESYGVDSTPAFLINGQLLVGAQPFSKFQSIIESELAK